MSYKYTNIDSTNNRSLYMYCEYQNILFLHYYEENRKLAIKIASKNLNTKMTTKVENDYLKKLREKLEHNEILKEFSNAISLKINSFKDEINKNNFNKLVFFLDKVFKNLNLKFNENINILNFIIKSYEVKKELYLFKKNIEIDKKLYYDFIESYHFIFSIVLINAAFKKINPYKCFNTLLKLNDLMIYKMYNSFLLNHTFLFYSLILESKIFNLIKKEKIGN